MLVKIRRTAEGGVRCCRKGVFCGFRILSGNEYALRNPSPVARISRGLDLKLEPTGARLFQ